MVESTIAGVINQYLAALPTVGIHASKAVLFGSFAKGGGDQLSDIDLIVIAPEFDGPRDISLVKSLWRATAADSRIEPIPCGEKEWETDGTRPILEIARREGIIVLSPVCISVPSKPGKIRSRVSMEQIEQLGCRIGSQFGAERVILFGSYARGQVTEDSDIDLLIVGPFKGRGVDKSVEIRMKLRPPFPVDLLVRTPEKVRERIEMGDSFMREILEQGKVLYEANER